MSTVQRWNKICGAGGLDIYKGETDGEIAFIEWQGNTPIVVKATDKDGKVIYERKEPSSYRRPTVKHHKRYGRTTE